MELIRPDYEYLSLLAIYMVILLALFQDYLPSLARDSSFWGSAAILIASWTALEVYGLEVGIWKYSGTQLCGVSILTVPLEEYIAFLLIHLSTIGSWRAFSDHYDMD